MRIGFGESCAGRAALRLSDLEEAAIESDLHGASSVVGLQINRNVCRTAET